MAKKKPEPQPYAKPDQIQIRGNEIFSPVRKTWVQLTPEERVRQEFLLVLMEEYGYSLEQIDEETPVTGRGAGQARADFLIWRTPAAKTAQEHALIVVECKADNVTISLKDYTQGANYAQYEHARFFVTHNHSETRFWKVDDTRRMPNYDEIAGIPHADATDKEVEELLARLKVFKEDEFADLLHQCHNVIRNREKRDPVAAFDEIAKILFVKVFVERELKAKRKRQNLFSVAFLEEQLGDNPLEDLFQKTKAHYRTDRIFEADEKLNLKPATGIEIVRLLEKYNLSDTSEDIKGIAFERFLGKTFRGEIGQFFTPRPIVEFMVRMVDPKEGDVICDPASGSGGFLIRFFELVRQQVLADADRQYQEYKAKIEADKKLSPEKKATMLRAEFDEIQTTLDHDREDSRLWKLANRCIYGTDANDRMARTSKMNMIMHGDGHGGVHHHDGFLNVNGIFEGRFDIILTNPPFGANVKPSDKILEEQVTMPDEVEREYARIYGTPYKEALARVRAAKDKPIASLFALPKAKGNGPLGKIKTELLFIERCLDLLKPGGRLGIVLPESVFNNPSLAYVREFCENRAFIRAVVSLAQDTFVSSGASVKASLLFMQKFTRKEQSDFDTKMAAADKETQAKYAPEITKRTQDLEAAIAKAKDERDGDRRKVLQKELHDYQGEMKERIEREARALLKERFPYPIFLYEAEQVGIARDGLSAPVRSLNRRLIEVYRTTCTRDVIHSRFFVLEFKDFTAWDAKSGRAASFRLACPSFRPMGDFIEEATDLARPSAEPDKDWPVYGVNNKEGVFLNSHQKGATFNTPYKHIRKDWFFHNPTRCNVGSLGIVPDVPDDAITSPEYQVWRLKADIPEPMLPGYVACLLQTPFFLELVQFNRVGAVKQRMYTENLMQVRIPYLLVKEQQRYADVREKALIELAAAKKRLAAAREEIEAMILGTKKVGAP